MYRIKSAILIVALLFALLLALTPPALAQEETREPGELATLGVVPTQIVMTSVAPPPDNTPEEPRPDTELGGLLEQYAAIVPWIVVIVLAAILGLVTIGSVGIVQAARLAPP